MRYEIFPPGINVWLNIRVKSHNTGCFSSLLSLTHANCNLALVWHTSKSHNERKTLETNTALLYYRLKTIHCRLRAMWGQRLQPDWFDPLNRRLMRKEKRASPPVITLMKELQWTHWHRPEIHKKVIQIRFLTDTAKARAVIATGMPTWFWTAVWLCIHNTPTAIKMTVHSDIETQ